MLQDQEAGTSATARGSVRRSTTRIGFFAGGTTIKTVPVSGGSVSSLNVPGGSFADWEGDTIVFFAQGQLYAIDTSGRTPAEPLGFSSAGRVILREPSFLPEGRRFLYTEDGNGESAGIRVGSLDSSESMTLLPTVSTVNYVPTSRSSGTGFLVFREGTTLVAQRFDPDRLELTGPVLDVVDKVRSRNGTPPVVLFSASASGTLAYQTAGEDELFWFDRNGRKLESLGLPGTYDTDQFLRFPSSVRRDPAIEAWMDAHPGELGGMARYWFDVMRHSGDDVRELLHDGCPVACVGDGAFAYVNAFKAHVNVGFFRGAELADPHGLLEGTGKFMRHVKLRPGLGVDSTALGKLIDRAYGDMKRRLEAG